MPSPAILLTGLLTAIAIHEAGHFGAARVLGYRPRLVFSKLGVGTAWGDESVRNGVRAFVSAAGPGASFLLAGLFYLGGQDFLALASLELCIVNLLPFRNSDGRKIWRALR
jgi:hypothetical protein